MADKAAAGFSTTRRNAARPGDTSDIVGDPIGREALISELRSEMIPYTPEEIIAIGEKEMAWCENEMKKALAQLGYGDDWHKALEHVKNLYVEPGKQPEMIRDLALEAIKFVEDNNLVTVPDLARESWRMEMMTPERQLVSPFFLGGEVIQVSFPTNTMAHEQKMMSMRGNNRHFSRATVHHELIPGHHLQGFMAARHKPYRGVFGTPFWSEGNALYWELLLWDLNFAKTPEDKIGMLFWRMHRCARIIFSLSFHLEKMTPQECIDLLVKKVGHERDNATAEVQTLVRRQLRSALSDRVSHRRVTTIRDAQGTGRFRKDDEPPVQRRAAERKPHPNRDVARRDHKPETDARLCDQLAVLRSQIKRGLLSVRKP